MIQYGEIERKISLKNKLTVEICCTQRFGPTARGTCLTWYRYVYMTWISDLNRLPTVHLVLGCGQQSRRRTLHRGSERNSENGHFRSLVRLPGTFFRPNYVKLTIRIYLEKN